MRPVALRNRLSSAAIALLLSFPVTGRSADYYLSAAGSDSNPGTQASPWQTIAKANTVTFAAGDRLLLRGGDSFGGNLVLDNEGGTAANPIRIASYGTGRATINAGAGTGILVQNHGGFSIANVNIVGSGGSTNTGRGVQFYNDLNGGVKLQHIRLTDLDVSGFRYSGIEFGAWPADAGKSGYQDVIIDNCASHDNLDAGISSYAYYTTYAGGTPSYAHTNFVVRNCKTFSNAGILNKGSHSGNGIVMSETNGITIERCISYQNGTNNNHTGGGPVGIWVWNTTNAVIQYNESYSNRTQTLDGGGFDLDGGVTNSILQYNYSHDNDGAGFLLYQFTGAYPFSGNTVRYNISQNDGRRGNYSGIYTGGTISNTNIYHNTIYTTASTGGGARAIRVTSGTSNFRFRNNILVTTGGAPLLEYASGLSGIVFQGNDYWSSGGAFAIKAGSTTYSSLTAWRTATGQEKNGAANTGLDVNPGFTAAGTGVTIGNPDLLCTVTAYELTASSPLIGAGLNLTAAPWSLTVGARDFWGNAIPQTSAYDIGAHERAAINLLNPGFEQGNTSWTSWGSTNAANNNAHSGVYSMRVSTSAGGRAQTQTLAPNTAYVLSGWGKVGASGETGWIGVSFYNSGNTKLGQADMAFTGTAYAGKTIAFTTPATTSYVQIWVWKDAGIGSFFCADDLHLRKQ